MTDSTTKKKSSSSSSSTSGSEETKKRKQEKKQKKKRQNDENPIEEYVADAIIMDNAISNVIGGAEDNAPASNVMEGGNAEDNAPASNVMEGGNAGGGGDCCECDFDCDPCFCCSWIENCCNCCCEFFCE